MARVPLVDPVLFATNPARFARNRDYRLYEEDGETPAVIYDAKTGGSTVTQPLLTGDGGVPSRSSDAALCWVEPGEYVREVDGITQPVVISGISGGEGGEGPAGPEGPKGERGEKGETGAAGSAGSPGLVWKGAWASGTEYHENDAVMLNGSSFRSKTATAQKGHEPPNGTYWEVLAEKGEQGSKGETGATGSTGPEGAKGATGAEGPKGATGEKGEKGATGPSLTLEERTFALPGEITTASFEGMGFYLAVASGETVKVRRLVAKIGSGTSATCKLQKNGSDITGFTGAEAKTTKVEKEPTAVEGADKDFISPVITAVSGTPKNIVITVVIERSR